MTVDMLCMGIMLIMILTLGPLFVIFGQVTVRKLRKNPETKYALGLEFYSGWDILNVLRALSRPVWVSKRFKSSKVSFLFADAEILYKHTTLFDRIFARILWFFITLGWVFMISVVIVDFIGFEFMNAVIDI